jgi:hypothetical protein
MEHNNFKETNGKDKEEINANDSHSPILVVDAFNKMKLKTFENRFKCVRKKRKRMRKILSLNENCRKTFNIDFTKKIFRKNGLH